MSENEDLLANSHNSLNKWKNYFSQLLNVHNVSDVSRQKNIRLKHYFLVPVVLRPKLLLQS
jgi:hypothetical protein